MKRLVFEPDRQRLRRIIGFALVGLPAAYFAIQYLRPDASVIAFGVTLVVFGGWRLWRLTSKLFRNELLVLDDRGLTDYSYGLGFIPWSNVADARIRRYVQPRANPLGQAATLIELDLRDPEAFFGASDTNPKMIRKGIASGTAGFWINVGILDYPEELVLKEIQKRVEAYSTGVLSEPGSSFTD